MKVTFILFILFTLLFYSASSQELEDTKEEKKNSIFQEDKTFNLSSFSIENQESQFGDLNKLSGIPELEREKPLAEKIKNKIEKRLPFFEFKDKQQE